MSTDNDTTLPRKCSKCEREFPATTEYFSRMSSSKDGLYPKCRECQRAYDKGRNKKEEHLRNIARKDLLADGLKECSICHVVKPLTEYYKQTNRTVGVKSACKSCYSVSMGWEHIPRKHFPEAPDGYKYCRRCEKLKHVDDFYDYPTNHNRDGKESFCKLCKIECIRIQTGATPREKFPDGHKRCGRCKKILPKTEQYFSRSSTHFQGMCKTCVTVYQKEYNPKNRHRKLTSSNRRRSRKLSLPSTLTSEQWLQCLEYFDSRCAVCGRLAGLWHFIAQDHWIPVNQKGDNPGTVVTNIIPLCHSKGDGWGGCNNSKSDHDPIEWLNWKFGKRKAKEIADRIQRYFETVQ